MNRIIKMRPFHHSLYKALFFKTAERDNDALALCDHPLTVSTNKKL